jgi:hypothetical protein
MDKQKQNHNNPVVWFEIYVDDMERAKKFYEAVLQIELEAMSDPTDGDVKMVSFPMNNDMPNASGALVKMDGFKAGGNSTIVYFNSEDCSVEEARVPSAGGEVFQTKTSLGEMGNMCLCKDSEGNMFGIHSMH